MHLPHTLKANDFTNPVSNTAKIYMYIWHDIRMVMQTQSAHSLHVYHSCIICIVGLNHKRNGIDYHIKRKNCYTFGKAMLYSLLWLHLLWVTGVKRVKGPHRVHKMSATIKYSSGTTISVSLGQHIIQGNHNIQISSLWVIQQ